MLPAPAGTAPPPHRASQAFRGLVQRSGVGPIRFHDLWRTAAALMLRAGVPTKIVSTRLGHATASLTLDTYSHVTVDLRREAASVIDAVPQTR